MILQGQKDIRSKLPVLVDHVKDAGKIGLYVLAGHGTVPVTFLTCVKIIRTLDLRLTLERTRGRGFAVGLVMLRVSLD